MKRNAAAVPLLLIAVLAAVGGSPRIVWAAGSLDPAIVPAPHSPAAAVSDSSAAADTSGSLFSLRVPARWSAIYGNRLYLSKLSDHFPWND